MDSNASSYVLNHATLPQVYYQGKEANSIIDLGLSLRTLQPETYHQPGHGNGMVVPNLGTFLFIMITIIRSTMEKILYDKPISISIIHLYGI